MAFPTLPSISFASADAAAILSELITGFQNNYLSLTGQSVTLSPSSPWYLGADSVSVLFTQAYAALDDAAKQNLLFFARGAVLDYIGEFWGPLAVRDLAAAALTTLQFNFTTSLTLPLAIPQNTQVGTGTSSGAATPLIFATSTPVTLLAGQTSLTVPAACQTAGAIGNGLATGTITSLVSTTIPFLSSVTNTTVTNSGADAESDDAYRLRLYTIQDSVSCAGTAGRYASYARKASSAVSDVSVYSPVPGSVNVVILGSGAALPTSDLITQVQAVVNRLDVRALTDLVTTLAPVPVNFSLAMAYYIDAQNAPLASQIQNQVTTAVTAWTNWQQARIGRPINPSQLIQAVIDAGASRVDLTAPVYAPVGFNQVAQLSGAPLVAYAGPESDLTTS